MCAVHATIAQRTWCSHKRQSPAPPPAPMSRVSTRAACAASRAPALHVFTARDTQALGTSGAGSGAEFQVREEFDVTLRYELVRLCRLAATSFFGVASPAPGPMYLLWGLICMDDQATTIAILEVVRGCHAAINERLLCYCWMPNTFVY